MLLDGMGFRMAGYGFPAREMTVPMLTAAHDIYNKSKFARVTNDERCLQKRSSPRHETDYNTPVLVRLDLLFQNGGTV